MIRISLNYLNFLNLQINLTSGIISERPAVFRDCETEWMKLRKKILSISKKTLKFLSNLNISSNEIANSQHEIESIYNSYTHIYLSYKNGVINLIS